jgi:hypothetical protein
MLDTYLLSNPPWISLNTLFILPVIGTKTLWGRYYYLHFLDEETKAHKTYLRIQKKQVERTPYDFISNWQQSLFSFFLSLAHPVINGYCHNIVRVNQVHL